MIGIFLKYEAIAKARVSNLSEDKNTKSKFSFLRKKLILVWSLLKYTAVFSNSSVLSGTFNLVKILMLSFLISFIDEPNFFS